MRKSALAMLAVILSLTGTSIAAPWAVPGGACTQEGANANSDGFLTCTGGVWVSNAVLMGTTSATCDSTKAGYIRYTGGKFEGCNGTGWIQLAGSGKPSSYAGATPTTYTGNLGGIEGANAKCAAAFPGSRMMKASEIVWFASSMVTSSAWVFDDIGALLPSHTYGEGGGCLGYSMAGSTTYGLNHGSGSLRGEFCNTTARIHCVID